MEKAEAFSHVPRLLNDALSLNYRAQISTRATALVGSPHELDFIDVVSLIIAREDQLGIVVDDDKIDADPFATLSSLFDFVATRL